MDWLQEKVAAAPPFVRAAAAQLVNSSLRSRLARGVFWTLGGAVLARGLALVTSIVVARLLGKDPYGALGVIQNTVGLFGALVGGGMGLTATKHVAEFRHQQPARAGRLVALSEIVTLGIGVLMAIALVASAPWLAAKTLADPGLAPLLQASAGLLVLSGWVGVQTAALAGLEAFRAIARASLFAGLCSVPIMLACVYAGGLWGAIGGLTLGVAVNGIINHAALRAEARRAGVAIDFAGVWSEARVLWQFSVPAALGGLVVVPVQWVGVAILVNQAGGYGEMGVFNAASQWRTAVQFVPGLLGVVLLPMLAQLHSQGDRASFRRVLLANAALCGGVALVVVVPLALLSRRIMSSYGAGFGAGSGVLNVLLLAAVLFASLNVVGQGIAALGRMWWGLALNGVWAVVLVTSAWLLRRHGALGLACAHAMAYGVHVLSTAVALRLMLPRRAPEARAAPCEAPP